MGSTDANPPPFQKQLGTVGNSLVARGGQFHCEHDGKVEILLLMHFGPNPNPQLQSEIHIAHTLKSLRGPSDVFNTTHSLIHKLPFHTMFLIATFYCILVVTSYVLYVERQHRNKKINDCLILQSLSDEHVCVNLLLEHCLAYLGSCGAPTQ